VPSLGCKLTNNFQTQVPESVYADGTSLDPSQRPFALGDEELYGQGNVFGLAGNKYGWIVEIDPANPNDYGTKHTWLGRYRHEAVGVRVEAGKPLAFYSGCDRTGGHIYKFVSRDKVQDPKNQANSQLLTQGILYGAKFNSDGTGRWIPLKVDTPIDPDLPSNIAGNLILLPKSPQAKTAKETEGDYLAIAKDQEIAKYKQKFKNLGDLYSGNAEEKQGAILTGEEFLQTRQVPLGSNWPAKTADAPPKPGVVVVTKASNS
jgi:hypothetical protein